MPVVACDDSLMELDAGPALTLAAWARRRRIVIGIAVLGGLIAAGGFWWVNTVGYADPIDSPQWYGVSSGPGITAFIIGSVMLLAALATIRFRLRPQIVGQFLWFSVWLGWLAIALICFGTELNTDVDNGVGAMTAWWGLFVGFLAFVAFVPGVIKLLVSLTRRDVRH
jgi:hypothetical protein